MADRRLGDPATTPDEALLEAGLGVAWPAWRTIVALTQPYARTWTRSKDGWLLKIHDRRKALLYLVPLEGGFRAAIAIREPERAALLDRPDLTPLRAQLADAPEAAEGFVLRYRIEAGADPGPLLALVEALARLRGRSAEPVRAQ